MKTKRQFKKFAKWVANYILTENIEDDFFCEVACRKLTKLGIVEIENDCYVLKGAKND